MAKKSDVGLYLKWCAERKYAPQFKSKEPFLALVVDGNINTGTIIAINRGGVFTYYLVDSCSLLQRVFVVKTGENHQKVKTQLFVTKPRSTVEEIFSDDVNYWEFFQLTDVAA